jgi:hypothetical protein
MLSPAQLAFLRRSQSELQATLAQLNSAFAAELHHLRGRIAMAGELLEGRDLAEEETRALLKSMIEAHPQGERAADLLRQIEDTERRLQTIEDQLPPA